MQSFLKGQVCQAPREVCQGQGSCTPWTFVWASHTGGCLCVWPEELFGIGSFQRGAERGLVSVMSTDISYLLVHLAYIRGEKNSFYNCIA